MAKLSASEIKWLRSLAQKKVRDAEGVFVVEGEKMVAEALASGFDVVKVYRRDEIGSDTMGRISSLATPSPALAVVRQRVNVTPVVSKGLYLALDSIRDPGNMGTILRIADWFGIDAVYASDDSVDIYNPKVVQSTMGAIFRVKFSYCDIPGYCRKVLDVGGSVYGTFLDGDDIYAQQLDGGKVLPSVIVVGNESNGISKAVAENVSHRLFIPSYPSDMPSGSESLNAAVATAVTVAEFTRVRRIC